MVREPARRLKPFGAASCALADAFSSRGTRASVLNPTA
jgi:hypothetical protein